MFNVINITGKISSNILKTEKGAIFNVFICLKKGKTICIHTAGKTAESVLSYCKKGDLVSICGTLTYNQNPLSRDYYVQASKVCFFRKDAYEFNNKEDLSAL